MIGTQVWVATCIINCFHSEDDAIPTMPLLDCLSHRKYGYMCSMMKYLTRLATVSFARYREFAVMSYALLRIRGNELRATENSR